jgi:GrpB-like predicted nucleotidyltransferase (UPF0157 family)
LVESIELGANDPEDVDATWMVGVQWHPEDTAANDPAQQSLFDALVLLARLRGSRAKPGEQRGHGREYVIAEPDQAWPAMFELEASRIRAALGALAVRVDHVGSTSVPDLAAKPIVDIQTSVSSMIPRDAYIEPLRSLGYRWTLDPWSDEHEYFSRDVGGARAYQIHVCQAGGSWERRHLAFRDWLRANPDEAKAYGALKHQLAVEHPNDLMAYVDSKTAFIRSVEARALADT